MKSVFDHQEGGHHYKDFVIQPIEFIIKNKLNWWQANIIKYVCRYPFKAGAKDLKKHIHYGQLALEYEYGIRSEIKYSDEEKETNQTTP